MRLSWKAHVHIVRHLICGEGSHVLSVHRRAARRAGLGRAPNGPFERTFRVLDVLERFLRGGLDPAAERVFRDWIEEARPAAEQWLLGARKR
jgi:hypothetical protein